MKFYTNNSIEYIYKAI